MKFAAFFISIAIVFIEFVVFTYFTSFYNIENPPCEIHNSINISTGHFFTNGSVYHRKMLYPKEYIFTQQEGNITTYHGCVCKIKPCIRKCCNKGHVLVGDVENNICEKWLEMDMLRYGLDVFEEKMFIENADISQFFVLWQEKPACLKNSISVQIVDQIYYQKDGKIFIPSNITTSAIFKTVNEYCVDSLVDNEGNGTQQFLAQCPDKNPQNFFLIASCMPVSCLFFMATILVYVFLPELRTIQGWMLINYLTNLKFGYFFLAIMQLLVKFEKINELGCLGMTLFIYTLLLVSFFWLNVMCFDIWASFCGHGVINILDKLSSRVKLMVYSAYAYGLPFCLTSILAAIEFSKVEAPYQFLLPNLRKPDNGCFINGGSKLFYLYGPLILLCIMNIMFFIMTAIKISLLKKTEEYQPRQKDIERFWLVLKLFTVMFVNWCLEFITTWLEPGNFIWRTTDTYNMLMGVIVFIIFVFKKHTFDAMKKRHKELKNKTKKTTTQTICQKEENVCLEVTDKVSDADFSEEIADIKHTETEVEKTTEYIL